MTPRQQNWFSTLPLLIVVGLVGFVCQPARAEVCTSATAKRDRSIPLGTCIQSGKACSSDSSCTRSANDYCMKGVCSDRPDKLCTANSQCAGSCIEDVTFEFDKPYNCGQFVTGDWWVEADKNDSVVIQSISPPHTADCESLRDGCRNGWAINPPPNKVAFSNRLGVSTYRPLLKIGIASKKLPHKITNISGFQSIVKAVDGGRNRDEGGASQFVALAHSAVLTVVPNGSAPAADAFRPAYHGPKRQARLYRVSKDLDVARLPRLKIGDLRTPGALPDFREAARYFGNPMLGIAQRNSSVTGMIASYQACRGYPYCDVNNGSSHYHAFRAGNTNRNLLRLVFEDADYSGNQIHQKALYGAVQAGIDKAWAARNWGGSIRIKDMAVPIMFSAMMLQDASLAQTGFAGFSEQDSFFDSPRYGKGHPGDYMFGFTCSETTYWSRSSDGKKAADKWCGDPYGYAEGTLVKFGGAYQECCSMAPWKGGALLVHLMRMESMLDVAGFLHVEDRYWNGWKGANGMDPGMFAAGDVCAAEAGSNKSNDESCHLTHSCECKKGSGRNPSAHGQSGGSWGESFSNAMWSSFRVCAAETFAGVKAAGFPCAGMVEGDPSGPSARLIPPTLIGVE